MPKQPFGTCQVHDTRAECHSECIINFKSSCTQTDRALAQSINWTCLSDAFHLSEACSPRELMNHAVNWQTFAQETSVFCHSHSHNWSLYTKEVDRFGHRTTQTRTQRHLQAPDTNSMHPLDNLIITFFEDSLQVANVLALHFE